MSMSVSYLETGRANQKARTRDALIAAARRLLAEGVTPTVPEAAAAASVSRATAYRYFPNERALIEATNPAITEESLLGEDPPRDVEARLDLVVGSIVRTVLEYEPELRAMLRVSLEPDHGDLPFRKGRRIKWVAEALEPLRGELPEPEVERLVIAIATPIGIEALVWLTDIAGLSSEAAAEQMRWTARMLLRSALAEDV